MKKFARGRSTSSSSITSNNSKSSSNNILSQPSLSNSNSEPTLRSFISSANAFDSPANQLLRYHRLARSKSSLVGVQAIQPGLRNGSITNNNNASNSNIANKKLSRSASSPSTITTMTDGSPILKKGSPGIRFVRSGTELVCKRSEEQKSIDPETLNLSRRHLAQCPIIEGEPSLRLLSYQHNLIDFITNISSMRSLTVLDFYNNRISSISGLEDLPSLRVLLLGKNQISKIDNLSSLSKLDVLDLHDNQLTRLENLSHFTSLRVLNCAGNQIEIIEGLSSLTSLTELNLRRNRVRLIEKDSLSGLEASLKSVFLSTNCIEDLENILELISLPSLIELTLDHNPLVSTTPNYRQSVLLSVPSLEKLDMIQVTSQERRELAYFIDAQLHKQAELARLNLLKKERQRLISVIEKTWQSREQEEEDETEDEVVGYWELTAEGILDVYGSIGLEKAFSQPSHVIPVTGISIHFIPISDLLSQSKDDCLPSWALSSGLKTLTFANTDLSNFGQLLAISKLPFLAYITTLNISPSELIWSRHSKYHLHALSFSLFPNLEAVNQEEEEEEEEEGQGQSIDFRAFFETLDEKLPGAYGEARKNLIDRMNLNKNDGVYPEVSKLASKRVNKDMKDAIQGASIYIQKIEKLKKIIPLVVGKIVNETVDALRK